MISLKSTLAGIVTLTLVHSVSFADHHKKILYKDAIAPVLGAKCGGCHGEKKQKGKLRTDSVAAMLKGGSEGTSLVPGKPEESSLLDRVHLPLDDDEHMPPEGKDQLTKDEITAIEFWIKSGAKEDATIDSLAATAEITKAITAVLAAAPAPVAKAPTAVAGKISEADQKLIEETIKKVNAGGGNLMAIAQNTPQLRYSALNVASEFKDADLEPLKSVGNHILWLNLARTKISDEGLAGLGSMKNLTRLHLEKTQISDAGLDHIGSLENLEYLNLYGTGITDAGIAKLSGNKKLKKLFLWQTKATDKGVAMLAAAVPGIDINTGWKEPVLAVAVKKAATTKAPTETAKKPTPPAPAKKPAPAPVKKPVKKTAPAKAAAPASAPKGTLEAALAELTAAAEKAKKDAAEANSAYKMAIKKVDDASRQAETMKAAADKATEIEKNTVSALEELVKAVEASRKK